jgi:AraC family transcriptional regulator of adaptative response/methylated-DNA-[protein]-cysteine methyltransferase
MGCEAAPDTQVIRYGFGESSLAALLVARGRHGVVAIIIREKLEQEAMHTELRRRFPNAHLVHDDAGLATEIGAVAGFVDDPRENLSIPVDIRGSAFQRAVYAAVLEVPFGETVTFSEIARRIGRPKAVRAVGSACTRNPLEFAIPCHRVLRSDGKWAGGSAWGDDRQAQLVHRERAAR